MADGIYWLEYENAKYTEQQTTKNFISLALDNHVSYCVIFPRTGQNDGRLTTVLCCSGLKYCPTLHNKLNWTNKIL